MSLALHTAFNIGPGDIVALVGAGGKTSAMIRLADELSAAGLRVLATTTTRVAVAELDRFPYVAGRACSGDALRLALDDHRVVFYASGDDGRKARGIAVDELAALMRDGAPDVVLIEADGSRRLPLKAPYSHEPVIPPEATLVIEVAGAGALGLPLDADHIYHAAGVSKLAGVPLGSRITPRVLAAALGRIPLPPGARRGLLINAVPDTVGGRAAARQALRRVLSRDPALIAAFGAVQSEPPIRERWGGVTALVLAAGMSRRMGQSKPLLPWGAQRVIERVLEQLALAGVTERLVVTGAAAEQVTPLAERCGAVCVHNPDYAQGEMLSSLQAGLRALLHTPARAALVTLGDQPMIRARNVRRLLRLYAEGRGSICAPSHAMKRGHPILIDRAHWAALLALPSGSAPRDVINQHAASTAYIMTDASVLEDIDTPEAYAAALARAGLTP